MIKFNKSPKNIITLVISTFFGVGFLPLMPGTFGSLAAIPLIMIVWHLAPIAQIIFWLLILLISIPATVHSHKIFNKKDPNSIVIDEVLGMAVATFTISSNPIMLPVAFLLFRFFDILKPPPIRQIDKLSQKKTDPVSAIFVIFDDLLAGLMALVTLEILIKFFLSDVL